MLGLPQEGGGSPGGFNTPEGVEGFSRQHLAQALREGEPGRTRFNTPEGVEGFSRIWAGLEEKDQ